MNLTAEKLTLVTGWLGSRLMEWTHLDFNGVTECARMKVLRILSYHRGDGSIPLASVDSGHLLWCSITTLKLSLPAAPGTPLRQRSGRYESALIKFFRRGAQLAQGRGFAQVAKTSRGDSREIDANLDSRRSPLPTCAESNPIVVAVTENCAGSVRS